MRNILKSNFLQAFSTSINYDNENAAGGVALWEKPEKIQNAFNPLIFTRSKWLHKTSTYFPADGELRPNFLHLSGNTISFDYGIASQLYVRVSTSRNRILQQVIGYGRNSWTVQNLMAAESVTGILSISLFTLGKSSECYDKQYLYIEDERTFIDDHFCIDSRDYMYKNKSVETSTLKIYDASGNHTNITAESYNGITRFDASQVVRKFFALHLAEFGSELIIPDSSLSTRYYVNGIGGDFTFVALNAVAQIGENPDRSSDVGKVLTRFSKLDSYDGYPLDYSALVGEEIWRSGMTANSTNRIDAVGEEFELQTEIGEAIVTDENETIALMPELDIPVFPHCAPESPFYVRWINQLGGVDYFMFCKQQKHAPQVKSVSTFAPYVANPYDAGTNVKAYAMQTENTIVVGTEGLNTQDFESLRWLGFARHIEYYSEKLKKWLLLSVAKFDGSFNTKNATHSVEVTFNLPSINTQF